LAACSSGYTSAEISQNVALATSMRASAAEFASSGRMSSQFSTMLLGAATQFAKGKDGSRSGFVFENGFYRYTDEKTGAVISLSLHLGRATSFGKVGDQVMFDAFSLDSYVSGLEVEADFDVDWSGVDADLDIRFAGAGPGFELLGLTNSSGALAINPSRVAASLGSLEVRGTIVGSQSRLGQRLDYELGWSGLSIDGLAKGNSLKLTAKVLAGKSEKPPQSLGLVHADLVYERGALHGSVEVLVTSQTMFDYVAAYDYAGKNDPTLTFSCSAR